MRTAVESHRWMAVTGAVLAALSTPCAAQENVLLGRAVTVDDPHHRVGTDGGWCCGQLAEASTVTDGQFLPIGQQWNIDTVFWHSLKPWLVQLRVELDDVPMCITSVTLQGDNNDTYRIRGRTAAGHWYPLANMRPVNGIGGMGVKMKVFAEPSAPVYAIGVAAIAGDSYYSVSELQATGIPLGDEGCAP